MKKKLSVLACLFLFFLSVSSAAERVEKKDTDGDGKIDAWTTYDAAGAPVVVAKDSHKRGKPDRWRFYKNGKIYKREWDRNGDGKPDFRILEENGKLIEKQYDDNFDGKFEKTVKTPVPAASRRVITNGGPQVKT